MAWCGTRRWALQAVRYALQQASLGQLLLPCTDLLTFHLRPRSIRVKVRVASSWWQHSTSSTTTVASPRLRAFKASSDHGASNGGLEPNKKVASSLTVCASRLAIDRRCKSCNAPFSPPCHPRLETTLISRRTSEGVPWWSCRCLCRKLQPDPPRPDHSHPQRDDPQIEPPTPWA